MRYFLCVRLFSYSLFILRYLPRHQDSILLICHTHWHIEWLQTIYNHTALSCLQFSASISGVLVVVVVFIWAPVVGIYLSGLWPHPVIWHPLFVPYLSTMNWIRSWIGAYPVRPLWYNVCAPRRSISYRRQITPWSYGCYQSICRWSPLPSL